MKHPSTPFPIPVFQGCKHTAGMGNVEGVFFKSQDQVKIVIQSKLMYFDSVKFSVKRTKS